MTYNQQSAGIAADDWNKDYIHPVNICHVRNTNETWNILVSK